MMDEYINKSSLIYYLLEWRMDEMYSGESKSALYTIDRVIDKIREFPAEGACTNCPRFEAMKEGK